jgi:hypothetical protein
MDADKYLNDMGSTGAILPGTRERGAQIQKQIQQSAGALSKIPAYREMTNDMLNDGPNLTSPHFTSRDQEKINGSMKEINQHLQTILQKNGFTSMPQVAGPSGGRQTSSAQGGNDVAAEKTWLSQQDALPAQKRSPYYGQVKKSVAGK